MAIRRSTGLIVLGIAATLLLALVFLVPALIRVDRYRPRVISYLQEKTGKQVEIGRLSLTFFPLFLHIDGFGVKNPPIFPRGYIVQVARIDAELSVSALLRRQVVIKSLVLNDPILNLTSDPDGPWNFENPQAQASQLSYSHIPESEQPSFPATRRSNIFRASPSVNRLMTKRGTISSGKSWSPFMTANASISEAILWSLAAITLIFIPRLFHWGEWEAS
jgi:AsmA protein